MNTLANAVAAVDGWPSVAAAAVTVLGGIVALILTQRSTSHKMAKTDDQLVEVHTKLDRVSDRVNDGHEEHMAASLVDAMKLMHVVRELVEKMQDRDIPLIRGDISRISQDVQMLRAELVQERQARASLVRAIRASGPYINGDHPE